MSPTPMILTWLVAVSLYHKSMLIGTNEAAFRSWTLTTIFVMLFAAVNQFFGLRYVCTLSYHMRTHANKNSLLSPSDMSSLSYWYFPLVEHGKNFLDGEFHWESSPLISTQGSLPSRSML